MKKEILLQAMQARIVLIIVRIFSRCNIKYVAVLLIFHFIAKILVAFLAAESIDLSGMQTRNSRVRDR